VSDFGTRRSALAASVSAGQPSCSYGSVRIQTDLHLAESPFRVHDNSVFQCIAAEIVMARRTFKSGRRKVCFKNILPVVPRHRVVTSSRVESCAGECRSGQERAGGYVICGLELVVWCLY
ncbi:MAG: hypothetical protein ACUVWX_09275, partial [Kiritimatiellia bacterium]